MPRLHLKQFLQGLSHQLCAGLAGSVLEERLTRTSAPAWYCDLQSDWKVLWLSLTAASRPDCLLDDLQIFFDPDTGLCGP